MVLLDLIPAGVQAHVAADATLRFVCRCGNHAVSQATPLAAAFEQLAAAWAEHVCR
jgi:hypothetical protein